MLLAGHETTAQALTRTWHLLAANPERERLLVGELDHVLGRRRPRPGDVDAVVYTRAVFLKTLRLCPPVWALARIATGPYTLDGWELAPGSTLIMSEWMMHRDPRWYHVPRASCRNGGRPGRSRRRRVLPVRRWAPSSVHRRTVRHHRGGARNRDDRPPLGDRPTPPGSTARPPLHAAHPGRARGDDTTPLADVRGTGAGPPRRPPQSSQRQSPAIASTPGSIGTVTSRARSGAPAR